MTGFRKERLIEIIQDTPQVIGMGMGENHIGYIGRIDTERLQRLPKLSALGMKLGPAPTSNRIVRSRHAPV